MTKQQAIEQLRHLAVVIDSLPDEAAICGVSCGIASIPPSISLFRDDGFSWSGGTSKRYNDQELREKIVNGVKISKFFDSAPCVEVIL